MTVTVGPANSSIDPNTGVRKYRWQGRELPSVTSMRRVSGIPHNLHQWAISQVVTRAVEQYDELEAMLTRERRPRERVLEKNRREEAKRWLRQAATEERDAKAELGNAVHDAAARGLSIEQVDEEVKPRLRQFYHWLEVSGAQIILRERQVWNLEVGYAGSFDLVVRMRDGSHWLIDIKSGAGTYAEHMLQVLAYAMAEFVGNDGIVDPVATQILAGVDGLAILHLADDDWTFVAVRPTAEAWAAYRGLVSFAVWTLEHPDIDSVTIGKRTGSAPPSSSSSSGSSSDPEDLRAAAMNIFSELDPAWGPEGARA